MRVDKQHTVITAHIRANLHVTCEHTTHSDDKQHTVIQQHTVTTNNTPALPALSEASLLNKKPTTHIRANLHVTCEHTDLGQGLHKIDQPRSRFLQLSNQKHAFIRTFVDSKLTLSSNEESRDAAEGRCDSLSSSLCG